jgi:hypothetical protein
MISRSNGASMTKLPLSVTTGPATRNSKVQTKLMIRKDSAKSRCNQDAPFATAIRRFALSEPSICCRFCRTLAYANGTTSMGTPGLNCGSKYAYQTTVWIARVCVTERSNTHVRTEILHIFPIICDKDECSGSFCQHLFSEVTRAASLDAVKLGVNSGRGERIFSDGQRSRTRKDILICTI